MLRLNELKNGDHTMWQPVKEIGKNFPSPYASLFCAAYAFRVTWSELSLVLATSTKCIDWEGLRRLGEEIIRFWIVAEVEAFKNTQRHALTL